MYSKQRECHLKILLSALLITLSTHNAMHKGKKKKNQLRVEKDKLIVGGGETTITNTFTKLNVKS